MIKKMQKPSAALLLFLLFSTIPLLVKLELVRQSLQPPALIKHFFVIFILEPIYAEENGVRIVPIPKYKYGK
jgi:hypothetical protein